MSAPFLMILLALHFTNVGIEHFTEETPQPAFPVTLNFCPCKRRKSLVQKREIASKPEDSGKKLKNLRTSFKYILNLESRDTYSDPGTGF